ncbi:uncharacterized protein LOC130956365 [Arachis stenosperma]|uniref:uncharacterized protein LOC130956365 n=1 Tax=Arachis stenosperma TaxID=217475 RepID=UPI0025AC5709|nr:uncharacterized protein LOC130956365 [Arachis stenosperma]
MMMTLMAKDEWVTTAMTDDTLVVNILLRLKNSLSDENNSNSKLLPFTWGLRQPRSCSRSRTTPPTSRCCDAAASTRRSPTTPLSWSGTADGYEDSTRNNVARSKGTATTTATSGYTVNSSIPTSKCRRKKTFAELKEQETSLLKERTYLKKEIEHLNANFEAQRAQNETLKRIKRDMSLKHQKNPSSKSDEECYKPSLGALVETKSHAASFLIPDLNMMPCDDE